MLWHANKRIFCPGAKIKNIVPKCVSICIIQYNKINELRKFRLTPCRRPLLFPSCKTIRQLADSSNKYSNDLIPKANSNLIHTGYFIETCAIIHYSKSHTTSYFWFQHALNIFVSLPYDQFGADRT